jgi:uncharacterized protein with FMN-binding domain
VKRFVLALAAPVTGLVLLLGFKTQPTTSLASPAVAVPSTRSHTPTTPAPGRTVTGSSSRATAPHHKTSTTPHHKTSTTAASRRTITGGTASTPYGPVQVQVSLTGRRITKVTPLQLPNAEQRSQQIASYAVPQLTQETLTAQSAHIDMVSGATYTSEGYTASLQSALDQAAQR